MDGGDNILMKGKEDGGVLRERRKEWDWWWVRVAEFNKGQKSGFRGVKKEKGGRVRGFEEGKRKWGCSKRRSE